MKGQTKLEGMSASNEWTDYHLTPQGWQEGSIRRDFGNVREKEPPSDRVQTYRWSEEFSSLYSRLECGGQVVWESTDKAAVQTLRATFGDPPSRLFI